MVFKGASSDPYLFKGLSEKQRAAILANANTRMFLSPGEQMIFGTSVEVVAYRERFIRQRVARNQNGLTRGRKRHKKHRRAVAIRKLLQMDSPPIFIDPMGDSDLLKKMLRAGQAQGREDDFCQLVFEPAGSGMSFLKDFKTVDGKTINGKKITIIDVGPTHRSLAAHLRATCQTAK